MALPQGGGSAVTPPGPMPPPYPAAHPQSSFSGLVEETQPIRVFVRACEVRVRDFYPRKLGLVMFQHFPLSKTFTHSLADAEHVALQLASKPHGDRWHQPCCLLQAAWLVQRCLSAARGARHQAKAIALPLTPPLPTHSPLSSIRQPPASICMRAWSSRMKIKPRGAWTRAPASLAACMGLHIASH